MQQNPAQSGDNTFVRSAKFGVTGAARSMSKAGWVEGKGGCGSCGEVGAGSLKKCGGCHRVAYCSAACQKRDWARHRGRCSPISITELEDRGRGLVATKDLNMGDLIVKDRAVICVGNVGVVLLLHTKMMITKCFIFRCRPRFLGGGARNPEASGQTACR